MSDRGMKKWAPFSSLIEQSSVLNEMFYEKNKKAKPQISSERASKINQILSNYGGEKIKIKYYSIFINVRYFDSFHSSGNTSH